MVPASFVTHQPMGRWGVCMGYLFGWLGEGVIALALLLAPWTVARSWCRPSFLPWWWGKVQWWGKAWQCPLSSHPLHVTGRCCLPPWPPHGQARHSTHTLSPKERGKEGAGSLLATHWGWGCLPSPTLLPQLGGRQLWGNKAGWCPFTICNLV